MPRNDSAIFYQLYFQVPGVAENELGRDVRQTFVKVLFFASGDAPSSVPAGSVGMVPRDGGVLSGLTIPAALPEWLREADIDFYAGEFARTGFRGGLNWYRNIDRNSELLAPFAGAKVTVPALYIVGDRDLVVAFRGMNQVIAYARASRAGLKASTRAHAPLAPWMGAVIEMVLESAIHLSHEAGICRGQLGRAGDTGRQRCQSPTCGGLLHLSMVGASLRRRVYPQ